MSIEVGRDYRSFSGTVVRVTKVSDGAFGLPIIVQFYDLQTGLYSAVYLPRFERNYTQIGVPAPVSVEEDPCFEFFNWMTVCKPDWITYPPATQNLMFTAWKAGREAGRKK